MIFVVIEVPQRGLPFPWQPFYRCWLRCNSGIASRDGCDAPCVRHCRVLFPLKTEVPVPLITLAVHPRKLTCPQKKSHTKGKVVFQPSVFRHYVSFRGSSCIDHISEGAMLLDSENVPKYTVLGSPDMSPHQVSHNIVRWHQAVPRMFQHPLHPSSDIQLGSSPRCWRHSISSSIAWSKEWCCSMCWLGTLPLMLLFAML